MYPMNILKVSLLFLIIIGIVGSINGYIMVPLRNNRSDRMIKTQVLKQVLKLKLRNGDSSNSNGDSNNNGIISCNEKYFYMKYLIGVRNFRKVYRFITDNRYGDIQNVINILNILNYINNTQISNTLGDNYYNNSIYIEDSLFHNNSSLFINNTSPNNDKIAKNLILSNIYIDVSTVKYIQISTRNETLIVELDKNNADISSASPNNIYNLMYDIGKIETLVSSISLLLKMLNIN
jgi:hypothetical protein